MNELAKILTISVKGNSYTICFPTVGQIIDIESAKASLSKGQYRNMVSSMTTSALLALDNIDMVATFSVLLPKLIADLKVETIFSLDLASSKELCDIYKKQYAPWYNKWIEVLSGKEEAQKDEK